MLNINNLTVKAGEKEILKDFNLNIKDGEIHVLMGPNGVGKSTICKALFHHPDYEITKGNIIFNGTDLKDKNTTDISRLGFFLLSQNPTEIEGITNAEMLRNVLSETTGKKVDIFEFNKKLNKVCNLIDLPKPYVHRDINFNMSGGEKKKNELLHLFMLEPKFIMLDEIDSGLDVDAIKIVGSSLKKYYDLHHPSILIVTHHQDILKYFEEYMISILENGRIVETGDKTLAEEIEKHGFGHTKREKTEANAISGEEKNE